MLGDYLIDLFTENKMYFINAVLMTVGLWKIFEKCHIDRKLVFIPFWRIYKLAKAADAEDTGLIWMILNALSFLMVPINADFTADTEKGTLFIIYIALALLISFGSIIYQIRIYSAICRLFGKRKKWVLVWLFFRFIAAFIWGFSEKYKPLYIVGPPAEAAPLSGIEAEASDAGLTVNLNKRTAWSGMKKVTLLRDIHFTLKPGRMVLLLGGSGAGKTTLINAVIGYEKADAKVTLNGCDVYKDYDSLKYNIALVPQQDLIRLDDTVVKTLTDAAVLRLPEYVKHRELVARVDEVLNIFGLDNLKNTEVSKLSGGQRKRVSIAMEYISNPDLFVLDEPDSGLDGVLARDLMTRLNGIARQGKIVIVITHSPDRVLDLFDDIMVLAKDADKTGRLVFFGTVEEAKKFFETDKIENVVRMINRSSEGGEGRADELIEKFMEVSHAGV